MNHLLLPLEAQLALMRAAKTEPSASDPGKRQKAIDTTTTRIKQQYPTFFKTEDYENENQAE
ncbi:hypothetical protein EAY64_06435 [Aquitalea palustris]|uniref:Uncharacterized protein n=1 Tax=Aquitalea palustris TaxID=2480983 RepID=A0A454JKX5_9NEIS|nr:hypothetical protein [Aquitalea palustris]RMC99938.1 hypothetical protein EAY64_06435 [Aquitalea palustris]